MASPPSLSASLLTVTGVDVGTWCNWAEENQEKVCWRVCGKGLRCWSRITKEETILLLLVVVVSGWDAWTATAICQVGAVRDCRQANSLRLLRQKGGKRNLARVISLNSWINLRTALPPHFPLSQLTNFLYSLRQLSQTFIWSQKHDWYIYLQKIHCFPLQGEGKLRSQKRK